MNKEVLIQAIEEVLQEFKEPVYIEKISDCCGIGSIESIESTIGHVVLDDGSFSNLTHDIATTVLKLQPTLKESEWVSSIDTVIGIVTVLSFNESELPRFNYEGVRNILIELKDNLPEKKDSEYNQCKWVRAFDGHFNIGCANETGERGNTHFKGKSEGSKWEFQYCPYCGKKIIYDTPQSTERKEGE